MSRNFVIKCGLAIVFSVLATFHGQAQAHSTLTEVPTSQGPQVLVTEHSLTQSFASPSRG